MNSSGSMVSGSVIIFDEMKGFESHIDEAEAEGDLETLVLSEEEEEELCVDLECESQGQGDKLVVTRHWSRCRHHH